MGTNNHTETTFLDGMANPDMVMVTLVSKHNGAGQRIVETGKYVNLEVFDAVDGAKEWIQSDLRRSRDEFAAKKGVDVKHVTWTEQWYRGPFDMTRLPIEDRPLIRLDWS